MSEKQMNHIKILARAMWLTAFFAMGILLIFAVISPTLAQGTMIEMWDVQGRKVGTATITATSDDKVMVTVQISDMLPIAGDRRVAISEVGKCDLPDFSSAGNDVEALPDIQFYIHGNAAYTRMVEGISLSKLADSDGSALIIYADKGDKQEERINCGIIAASNAMSEEDSQEDSQEHSSQEIHWDYEGEAGAEAWGDLHSEFALCSDGKSQSPIDITDTSSKDLDDIAFKYQKTSINIVNKGHTIQVNYDAGSTIQVDGMTFELKQFHFHAPSEHTINGQHFELEMHLVHQSNDGTLAVIGLMIGSGAKNANFAPIWNNLPTSDDQTVSSDSTFNVNDLLPTSRLTYRYSGSLTTPPCSENVKWMLLTSPVEMSEAQINTFKNIIHNNNRPVQPINEREILKDSAAE